ncbi:MULTISPECIES: UDP-N-acetylmuramoyl-L-alanyl-D-glutamate--2,6-diaminopimelate ligase [unclassified Neisseria]|uniref:UDP-N-acetylmuramoyl-L-alanyl-D-glutamate--2, 6-diaminopimelate ligase n=1 Tax=unclassified Neisseria TaxID=2623750 RepID=UPI0010721B4F|nr:MULTISPECIES: UDP-N-acetylmuramoyl-L-alanyl-D-glutamate--2,6-diaminopimelate ligase [unclassified Neisseria]MBF0804322.1 UDP-N-acetylmuramoyl-L-alanyl-D-glutamate--2,6-diaminopimelate ligase [Neisseria sp. 19428wB4_WF04]TFU42901.1 UDP-N-acetylmuramoyl-L-alanyl-D-glutamate--2,6-diaminopimelate ligase [Neisseria sp. WF04]
MFSESIPPAETDLPPLLCQDAAGRRLHSDSRKICPGDIFIACTGEYTDGRSFIPDAIRNGAAFVFWDDDGSFSWYPAWSVPNQGIKDLKNRAGILAAALYGNISDGLSVWGVTGTNGKTSITQWLAQAADILEGRPGSCAVIGTVGNGFWGSLQETAHTTPDPVSVQTLLHSFKQQGARAVAMEVSSHGLDQARVNGVSFQTAVFTNLTRDHLDYHGSMEAYGEIKSRLFYWHGLQHAVMNADDAYGAGLAGRLKTEHPGLAVYRYGFAEHADIRITGFTASSDGMTVTLDTPWGAGECRTRLLGRFNAQNLAACVGVLCAAGYPLQHVLGALERIRPATGRMDCIMNTGKPLVVVDYAHTPDALEKALATLQEIKPQGANLWCVFGCGGNRDKGKRPLMGFAAVAGADKVVVTSDNPRMEEPADIINDILPAVPDPEHIEADRRSAIGYAVKHAAAGDIILIAGKGHETYQDVQGEKHHFSDFEEAEKALAQR